MRRALSEIAAAVAAAVVVYAILTLVADVKSWVKWALVAVVAVASFAVAAWVGGRIPQQRKGRAVEIGTGLRSDEGQVGISDIDVGSSDETIVGKDIRSRGDTTISGVDVNVDRDKNQ
jgi:hypothetical protein